jgi:hypothetical protein
LMTRREIIQGDYIVAGLMGSFDHVGSNIASTSNNKYFHLNIPDNSLIIFYLSF